MLGPSITTDADQARLAKLRRQLEFYFSERNLQRDLRLRAEITAGGEEGWVNCKWLLECPLVSALASSADDITTSLKRFLRKSEKFNVN